MKPLARIIVRETAGIRRFLYPLKCHVQTGAGGGSLAIGHLDPPSAGESWRVAEKDGTLVPSSSRSGVGQMHGGEMVLGAMPSQEVRFLGTISYQEIHFAVSLAPFEERELHLVETNETSAIPDAMRLALDEQEGLTTHQERVSFHIGAKTGLDSVIYDGVQHLADPLSVTLDGAPISDHGIVQWPKSDDPGLAVGLRLGGDSGSTTYSLTACKSWIAVSQRVTQSVAGKTLAFTLPLRLLDEIPTCDFGVGDGIYEKIGGDAVMWTTEFGEKPYAKWRVSTINAGVERIDYQGEYQIPADYKPHAWFHFTEKTKALAVAIPFIHRYCNQMTATLAKSGKVEIAFAMSPDAPAPAGFSVCYHFLNDIPAIAAATNPASILLPPVVTLTHLD